MESRLAPASGRSGYRNVTTRHRHDGIRPCYEKCPCSADGRGVRNVHLPPKVIGHAREVPIARSRRAMRVRVRRGQGAAVGAAHRSTWDLAAPTMPAVAMVSTAETISTGVRSVTLRAAPTTVGVTMEASAPATNRAVNPVDDASGNTCVTQIEMIAE